MASWILCRLFSTRTLKVALRLKKDVVGVQVLTSRDVETYHRIVLEQIDQLGVRVMNNISEAHDEHRIH